MNGILKEAWTISKKESMKEDKIKPFSFSKRMLCELLTNPTVVDDAIGYVASHTAIPKRIGKAKSVGRVTVDEEISNNNYIKDLRKP